jgi:hypothetical protein
MAQQKLLPRLPLPSLKDTVARYLDQLEPLVDVAAFREAKDDAAEFLLPGGRGEELQVELEARNNANTQVCACIVVDLHVMRYACFTSCPLPLTLHHRRHS